MPFDEGYIKFRAHWTRTEALPLPELHELLHWRTHLYALGLIGVYSDGIGYGNISQRRGHAGQFIISGSATGQLAELSAEHFCLVTRVAAAQNTVWCEGPVIASSETMSHAVIYAHCPEVGGVIHVHHAALWRSLLHRVPTTPPEAPYGSPAMAEAIRQLLEKTDLRSQGLFVMAGHPEGIFAFGYDLAAAAAVLLEYF